MKYVLFLLTLSAHMAYGQYKLSLNLEKGNTYFLKINSVHHFTAERNGQNVAVNVLMNGVMKFIVTNSTAQSYEMEASYDTLHITMRSPMGQMEFSSGNSPMEEAGPLNAASGRHFVVTLLKTGAVSKIECPDTTGLINTMKNNPMMKGLQQMLSMGPFRQLHMQSIKENIENLTAIFPNKPVSINETWSSVVYPGADSSHFIKTSYRLVSYESGIATLRGHCESQIGNSEKKASSMGWMFPFTLDLDGTTESTLQINTSTGWIKEASIKNELQGHIKMNSPKNSQTKASPIEMTGDIRISGD